MSPRKLLPRITVLAQASSWLSPGLARAADDGYQPVAGQAVETIAASPFIAGAYGFIWVALLVYVVSLARGLSRARAELAELRRKLEQS